MASKFICCMCAILYSINFSFLSLKWTWLCKEKSFHPLSCYMPQQREDMLVFACWRTAVEIWWAAVLPKARTWMINVYLVNWLVKPLHTWLVVSCFLEGCQMEEKRKCNGLQEGFFSFGWLEKKLNKQELPWGRRSLAIWSHASLALAQLYSVSSAL